MRVFVYGRYSEGGEEHSWVRGLPARPATVRGRLWTTRRRRLGLVPELDGERLPGLVFEVDPARLAVLDLLEHAEGVRRIPVTASVALSPLRVDAWVLPDAATAQREGWRPLRGRGRTA